MSVTGDEPPDVREFHHWTRLGGLEVLLLLASPLIVFLVLDVRVMAPFDMIDMGYYTAYSQHGGELMDRYGLTLPKNPVSVNYFWVRFGFILPARSMYLLFGPVGGFYALRYLLALVAVVPAYLLFRRLHHRWAGAVAVLVILSSPVVLLAWGTDYPDSSVVSYLIGGMACLVMPATSPGRRLLWVAASGTLLSLAVHSQAVAVPLVLGAVAGYLIANMRRPIVETATDAGLIVATLIAITVGFTFVAGWWYGQWNIILPTLSAGRQIRSPEQINDWHSLSWRWALYVPYVVVPLSLAGAWTLAWLRDRTSTPREELAIGAGFLLQVLACFVLQFGGGRTAILEFHLFSSMLWAGACLTLAFVLVRLFRPLVQRGHGVFAPLVVLAVPLVYSVWRPTFEFENVPIGVLLGVGAAMLVLPARRSNLAPFAAVGAAGAMMAILLVLTVAVPPPPGEPPGSTFLPKGQYAAMLGGDGTRDLDVYRVASKLPSVVPPPRRRGEDLMMWFPADQWDSVNPPAAQYLWLINSLSVDMPRLTDLDREELDRRQPRILLLISERKEDLPAAQRSIEEAGYNPRVREVETLRSGSFALHVLVLELRDFG